MTIFINLAKSANISGRWDNGNWDAPNGKWDAPGVANLGKSLSIWQNPKKAGMAYAYDEPNVQYDGPTDPLTGLPLYYNGEGTLPVFTNLAKS